MKNLAWKILYWIVVPSERRRKRQQRKYNKKEEKRFRRRVAERNRITNTKKSTNMLNVPNIIFLQTGGKELEDCHDFDELKNVTWEKSPVNSDDAKYLRSQNMIFELLIKKQEHELPNDHSSEYNQGYVKAMNDFINFIKNGAISKAEFSNTKK